MPDRVGMLAAAFAGSLPQALKPVELRKRQDRRQPGIASRPPFPKFGRERVDPSAMLILN